MTKHETAAAPRPSDHSGEFRGSKRLPEQVSEIRGEVRVVKWASAIAVVAILGGMGVLYQNQQALYQNQQALGRSIQEVREDVGRIDERTIHLDKRLSVIEEMLRVLVARTSSNS